MDKLRDYLRISEAADYLGVSPNTLRNWGRGGKLAERRHPMNGYRLYAQEELAALLRKAEMPESGGDVTLGNKSSSGTKNRRPKPK